MTELVGDDQLALSDAYEALGRYDLALDFHRRYKATRDRIFDDEKSRTMAAAQMRFDVDLKDQEIAGLKREAEFEAFRRRILLVGAGLSLLIIALLYNRYRFQKKAHTAIRASSEALAVAHAKLEKVSREELTHVARVAAMGELAAAFAHEINQPLAAIKANARAARDPARPAGPGRGGGRRGPRGYPRRRRTRHRDHPPPEGHDAQGRGTA